MLQPVRFYEDLLDLLELTCRKYVLFIIWDWNAKVVSQEIPGVTSKFGLGVQNEAGQSLTEICQENALVTRPFSYDLNQIPYDYAVEMTNRFKGLDRIVLPEEL